MTTYTGGTGITVDNTGNVILVDNTVVLTNNNSVITANVEFTGTVDFTSASVVGNPGYTGSQGVRGYTGSLGATGSDGVQGNVGFTGSAGFNGSVGFTGSAGFTGSVSTVPGPQGNIGYTGSAGSEGPTGFSGSQGNQGTQGDTGFTGSQGPQGPAGPAGDGQDVDAFRTVRVVDQNGDTTNIIADQSEDYFTMESGANISLTVVEDRITISAQSPIGFTGSRGFTGSQGFQGSQGDRGFTGSIGPSGRAGETGFSGSIGFTGSQGVQGNIGYTGSAGPQGNAGLPSSVPGPVGFTGSRGIIGFTGSQGPLGPQGNIGVQGTRGPIGFTGSMGVQGFTGSAGNVGFTGSQGFTGSIGFSGSRGNTGFAGSRGFSGSQGNQGPIGIQGLRGYTGSRGNQGIQGQTGYSGSRGFVGSTGYTGSRGPIGPQGQTGIGYTGSRGGIGFTGSQGGPAIAFRTFRTENSDGTTSLIIADQADDVMTFQAGAGMILDFNEATDTIVFASTGGGGGGGNSNIDLSILNNAPEVGCSFIAYDEVTGVLEYTPYDITGLATTANVNLLYRQSTDYTNATVFAEQTARQDADQQILDYVNTEVNRLELELSSNVITINDSITEANVYLQARIATEANLRIAGDANLQDQIDDINTDLANISTEFDGNVQAINTRINQVESNSISRDNTLQSNIDDVSDDLDQEVLARIAGDQQLQANIDNAVISINSDITDLENDLQAETNARISADTVLSDRITTEAQRNDTQDGDIDSLEIRVDTLENNVQLSIDYDSDLSQLGSVLSGLPANGRFIPLASGNVVTNNWSNVEVLSINSVDNANVFHFLDRINATDNLVMLQLGAPSYARYEVMANAVVENAGGVIYANVSVAPIDVRGNIVAGTGANASPGLYQTELFPAVAGDVPTYDYVDAQDNLRVLKTGDTMTGALNLYDDPQSFLEAATKRYVDTRVERTGDTMTGRLNIASGGLEVQNGGFITVTGGGDVVVQDGGNIITQYVDGATGDLHLQTNQRDRLKIRDFITNSYNPIRYNQGAVNNMTNDYDLVYKGYVDAIASDLGNVVVDVDTKVSKTGDSLTGSLQWDTIEFDDDGNNVLRIGPGNSTYWVVNTSGSVTQEGDLAFRRNTGNTIKQTREAPLGFVIGNGEDKLVMELNTEYRPEGGAEIRSIDTYETLAIRGGTNNQRSIIFEDTGKICIGSLDRPRVTFTDGGVQYNGILRIRDAIKADGNVQVGRIDMGSKKIINLKNPTDPQEGATKFYVDNRVANAGNVYVRINETNTPTSDTVMDMSSLTNPTFVIKNNQFESFQILTPTDAPLFTAYGNDIRIENNDGQDQFSVLSRTQNDNRYIRKDETTTLGVQTTIRSNQAYPLVVQNDLADSGIFFELRNVNGTTLWSVNGDGIVTKPRVPTQDTEVPNKKYVDDEIATIRSNLVSPGRRFAFEDGGGAGNINNKPGKFTVNASSISFNLTDLDGLKIYEASTQFVPGIDMPISVYSLNSGGFRRICFATYGQNPTVTNNGYLKINLNTTGWILGGPSVFDEDVEYYIVVGGLWS